MRPLSPARRTKPMLAGRILLVAAVVGAWTLGFIWHFFIVDTFSPPLPPVAATSIYVAAIGLATAMTVMAISEIRQMERVRRSRGGACLSCGYSLEGNVSGVCPECGTPVLPSLTVSTADYAVMYCLGA